MYINLAETMHVSSRFVGGTFLDFVHDPRGHSQAARDEPRELVFVADRVTCAEAEGFLDADAFAHDPPDQWYRQPRDDEPRELTYVDEDTFWSEF